MRLPAVLLLENATVPLDVLISLLALWTQMIPLDETRLQAVAEADAGPRVNTHSAKSKETVFT